MTTLKVAAKPCPSCPFSRWVTPGALGGSSTSAYVGQVYGPFVLPCHSHYGSDGKGSTPETCKDVPQCAGAAVMRTHLQLNLPEELPRLPANPDVFSDMAEFVGHHLQVSVERVREGLTEDYLRVLVQDQIDKARRGEKP